MELLEIVNKLIEYFKLDDIGDLGDKLKEILFSDELENVVIDYKRIVNNNLEIDWIQKIYQYYKSNRGGLKQDYTPKCLSKLLAKLVCYDDAKSVLDVCAGSGSLSIELYKLNNSLEFTLLELDEQVLPFLLFNLVINGINAKVVNMDVLSGEQFKVYVVKNGKIEIEDKEELGVYDIVISNPPFNLKLTNKYNVNNTLIKNSSNAYFVHFCMEKLSSKGKCSLILPTGFIAAQKNDDLLTRKYLIDNNYLDSIIIFPTPMFESTGVCVSTVTIDKNKQNDNVILINNNNQNYEIWIREQRGQFGGASHTKRVYKKEFKILSDKNINYILDVINNRKVVEDYSIIPTYDEMKEKSFSCSAGQYFDVKIEYIDITQEEWETMRDDFISQLDNFVNSITDYQEKFKSSITASEFMEEQEKVNKEIESYNKDTIEFKNTLCTLLMNGQLVSVEE